MPNNGHQSLTSQLPSQPVIHPPGSGGTALLGRAQHNLYWQDPQLSQFFLIKGAAEAAAGA